MDTEQISTLIQSAIQPSIGMLSTWGIRVVGALTLLVVGRIAAAWLSGRLNQALTKAGTDASLIPFFASMAYYAILAVVIIAVLNLFGIETTSLIAMLGAAGLAIGLALQGTLSNFAAGVMLLVFRPIRVGDFIEAAGVSGTVAEISIFSTLLNTGDNVRIVIPNAKVYGQTIKNFSHNDTRRIDLVIGVGYGDNLGRAAQIIEEVLQAEDRVLKEPEPKIAVSELGDSSVNFVVRPWCATSDYWPTRWALTRALKEKLEEGGCSIPFPQRDVHVLDFPAKAEGS